MRPLFYCFILLLCCHCSRAVILENAAFPSISTQKLNLSIDSFVVPSSVYDSVDYNFLQSKEINDSLYLFLLNANTKKLELYNLDAMQQIWELGYENLLDSFHSSQKIWSVYFHNLDTVVFQTEYSLNLVNRKKVIYQQIINNPEATENTPYTLMSQQIATVWDNEKLGFWAQGYCSLCTPIAGDRFFKTPIEVFIPADSSQKYDTLPVTYPERYYKKEQGFNNYVHREKVGNKHIYSFAAEPNIFSLDVVSGKIDIFAGRSQSDTSENMFISKKDAFDADIKLRILTTASQYKQILFDKYRNVYYRFFSPQRPEKDADGFYNLYQDKTYILMVFDQNFNIIGEYPLPKQKFAQYAAFVGKKGLYLPHLAVPYSLKYEHKFSIFTFNNF
jgi:Domain of unknown function (DUF4221)